MQYRIYFCHDRAERYYSVSAPNKGQAIQNAKDAARALLTSDKRRPLVVFRIERIAHGMETELPIPKSEEPIVPVVFRRDRTKDGSVFAMFPTIPADYAGKYCTCYEHVGQHSSADYFGCMLRSRPAKPGEYRDLKTELQRRGYRLQVIRRATQKHHAELRAELRQYRLAGEAKAKTEKRSQNG